MMSPRIEGVDYAICYLGFQLNLPVAAQATSRPSVVV